MKMAETSQPIHTTDDVAAQTEAFSTLLFYLTESLCTFPPFGNLVNVTLAVLMTGRW